jgi:hypothetical protein
MKGRARPASVLFSLIVLIDVLVPGLAVAAIVIVVQGRGSKPGAANQALSYPSSAYPVSGQKSFLQYCEGGNDSSTSQCQCELNWAEASVPYATWVKNQDFWYQDAAIDSGC